MDEEQAAKHWYDRKSAFMEESLGKEHDMVMHAIFPYAIGGALDLYYYPNGIPGTAIATKELSALPNDGPSNSVYRSYELVMFTKHAIDLDSAKDENSAFGRAHSSINAILNCIARYSAQARLNPGETCEFPADMKEIGGKCLFFDGYTGNLKGAPYELGLLAIIEVHRSEMNFARKNGGEALWKRLKKGGDYPYSDLDREPVA